MHQITAYWEGDMQFSSTNPSGNSFFIDTTPENGGENNGMHPKALMLSSLAGCTGLDVLALLKKKHIELDIPQITHVVSLSVEKYCGVIAMFRQFATVHIQLFFNGEAHPYNAE